LNQRKNQLPQSQLIQNQLSQNQPAKKLALLVLVYKQEKLMVGLILKAKELFQQLLVEILTTVLVTHLVLSNTKDHNQKIQLVIMV